MYPQNMYAIPYESVVLINTLNVPRVNLHVKKHCIFCGMLCLNRDPNNPKSWCTVVKCRTANWGVQKSFKTSFSLSCMIFLKFSNK